jgi:hypothetical protein
MVIVSSIAVSAASVSIILLLASVVYGVQTVQLSQLNKNIKDNTAKLKSIDGLDKILTIQNQLNNITKLHTDKPVVGRLFTFLPQVTPNDVQISTYNISFTEPASIQIQGTAKSLEAVNKFVDTLKFTNYTVDGGTDEKPAFSSVVLSSFGRSDKDASYNITMKYDSAIFSSSNKQVTLVVPKITSTRSQTEQPPALFKEQPQQTQQAQ